MPWPSLVDLVTIRVEEAPLVLLHHHLVRVDLRTIREEVHHLLRRARVPVPVVPDLHQAHQATDLLRVHHHQAPHHGGHRTTRAEVLLPQAQLREVPVTIPLRQLPQDQFHRDQLRLHQPARAQLRAVLATTRLHRDQLHPPRRPHRPTHHLRQPQQQQRLEDHGIIRRRTRLHHRQPVRQLRRLLVDHATIRIQRQLHRTQLRARLS